LPRIKNTNVRIPHLLIKTSVLYGKTGSEKQFQKTGENVMLNTWPHKSRTTCSIF